MSARYKLALRFADSFLGAGGPPPADVQAALLEEFTEAELVEMSIGLALFHGVSKMLIALGLRARGDGHHRIAHARQLSSS